MGVDGRMEWDRTGREWDRLAGVSEASGVQEGETISDSQFCVGV